MTICGHRRGRRLVRPVADERGFALLLALGCCVVLSIAVVSMTEYATQNVNDSRTSSVRVVAKSYAEAALNAAYSALEKASDPTVATLLGNGAPQCISVAATCTTSSTSGQAGTATLTGTYDSTATTWTLNGNGYAAQGAKTVGQSMTATVKITADPNTPQNVAVWNYIYSTSPQSTGCEFNITNASVYVDVPVYVTGDMCMTGFSDAVWEQTGGQPVSLQVMGKLVLAGGSDSVGYQTCDWQGKNCTQHPITSGGVALGCSTTFGGATAPCNNGSFQYYVKTPITPQAMTPPTVNQTTVYQQADPGPSHPCKAGTTPAPPPASAFDNDSTPNDSAAAFNLTPTTSYTCLSQIGSGQLSWNASTDQLTISGEIYIDGNVNVTQSGTYTGTGTIYSAGSFTFACSGTGSGYNSGGCNSQYANGQGGYYPQACGGWGGWGHGAGWGCTSLCANTYCSFGSWNPTTQMLLLASLANSGNGISFYDNADIFQGGIYTQQGGTVNFPVTGLEVQGPIVGGKFNFANVVILEPLPSISQLPPGAPLSVNAKAIIGSLQVTSS